MGTTLFLFETHGSTSRVVSYVLAKFHIDPCSAEASEGLNASIEGAKNFSETPFERRGITDHHAAHFINFLFLTC